MKVTTERLPDSQVELNVEVEPEVVSQAVDKAFRRLVNKVNIPGFRRGKAPRQVVERMVGRETLWQEGVEELIPRVYRQAIEETGTVPIDQPQVDVTQQEPLVLKFIVPVQPEVELADYQSIRIPRVEVGVTDADVAAALEQIREQNAKWETVARPAEMGDQLKADVEGWVGAAPLLYSTSGETLVKSADAETIIDSKDIKIWISPENRFPVPGFAEQLVGAEAGQLKEFRLTLPADFPQKEYANRSVAFRVNVHEVQEKRLPELGDDLAKEVGDYESFEAMKDGVRQELQARVEYEARRQLEDTVVQTVVDQSKIELPPTLVDREVDHMLERLTQRLRVQSMSLEQYLKIVNKTEDQLREELRGDAVRNLKTALVLDRIADSEKVEVSDLEVSQRIDQMAESLGEEGASVAKLLQTPEGRENIGQDMRTRKTVERLVELATRTEGESAEESAAGGEAGSPAGEETPEEPSSEEEGPAEDSSSEQRDKVQE